MNKRGCLIGICCLLMILPTTVLADDMDPADLPWKKNYLNVGYYWAFLNSSFRLGETNLVFRCQQFIGTDTVQILADGFVADFPFD